MAHRLKMIKKGDPLSIIKIIMAFELIERERERERERDIGSEREWQFLRAHGELAKFKRVVSS